MIAFFIAIIPLFLLIIQEFFSAKAKADAEGKKFVLDQAQLKAIVDAATSYWNSKNAKDSKDAGDAWDKSDNWPKT